MKRLLGLAAALLTAQPLVAVAQQSKTAPRTVRILTWWDYLEKDLEELKRIEESCNVNLSIDEYYSNSEFLSRLELSKYDTVIFSDTMYPHFSKLAQGTNVDLGNVKEGYHPAVKSFFENQSYASNVTLFQLSLTGFLWNEKQVSISASDSLSNIFNKAGTSRVVFVDDYVEFATLMSSVKCAGLNCKSETLKDLPEVEQVRQSVGPHSITFTSDLARIPESPDFGFAYTWSGAAFEQMQKQSRLKFLVHPKLSHVSADLLAVLKNSTEAKCAASHLSAKAFLSHVTRRFRYFSPYGKVATSSLVFDRHQKSFFDSVSSMRKLIRVEQSAVKALDDSWRLVKTRLGLSK